ncbi:uncharacterized protein LOC120291100 [Eucalyptus grandis]|uniref:uncharacterized protein LOC120291100 n=1 Tax=Eucalyptus grandis TaxID=71139 RepID=UPI00192EC09C|nr:uncharacterized protein LOC120291100 [Eucalyptus grandis]
MIRSPLSIKCHMGSYELVRYIVWIDVGFTHKVPYRYRSWYRQAQDGQRQGLLPEFEIPLCVLEAAFGKGNADPPPSPVVDASNLNFEDLGSPVQSAESSSWSEEDGEEDEEDDKEVDEDP